MNWPTFFSIRHKGGPENTYKARRWKGLAHSSFSSLLYSDINGLNVRKGGEKEVYQGWSIVMVVSVSCVPPKGTTSIVLAYLARQLGNSQLLPFRHVKSSAWSNTQVFGSPACRKSLTFCKGLWCYLLLAGESQEKQSVHQPCPGQHERHLSSSTAEPVSGLQCFEGKLQ